MIKMYTNTLARFVSTINIIVMMPINVESSWLLVQWDSYKEPEPEQVLVTWDTVIMATLLNTQTKVSLAVTMILFMNLSSVFP